MSEEVGVSLGNLYSIPSARKERIRRGRGTGSGLGKTAGRGGKGQTARAGKGRPRGFEGGQTPLHRRVPKFGFKNPLRKYFEIVNVRDLEKHFGNGESVTALNLAEKKLIRSNGHAVKILGNGDLTKKLTVQAHKFSQSALQKINQAGGKAETIALKKGEPEPESGDSSPKGKGHVKAGSKKESAHKESKGE